LLLYHIVARARVINQDGLNVIIFLVLSVEHGVRNIWHVVSSIAFSSDIDFLVLQTKGIYEILEEAKELRRNLVFVGCSRDSLRESSAYRLLNPDHVGQVYPSPWVVDRLEGAVLPDHRPVFLEETFE